MTTTKEEPKPENASILTHIPEDRTAQDSTFVLPKPKFRFFGEQSYVELLEREEEEKKRALARKNKPQEAHLVDGELKFDDDEDPHEKKLTRDPYLAEGQCLSDSFGIFPSTHFGKPLEEIDQYIKDKTFIVIAKRFQKKFIYRFSATPSFFIFTPWNPLRRLAVRIATNQIFDYFVILTILVNCIFLAMPTESFTETSEYVFLAIYMLEMVIKLIARGFIINSYTYLRDPWNWLDFIVIVMAVITLIVQSTTSGDAIGNLTGLRTFRVLRALKTVSIVPGLKTIVNALLRAFKMLIEVITLTMFCLMVFALFALQVYMGTLRQKCVADPPYYVGTPSMSYDVFYATHIKNSSNWLVVNEDFQLCGNASGAGKCPANYTCLPDIGENPNSGYTNFDHFGWAMLNAFQLITLDFWEDCYNKVIRSSGPWNIIFFLIVVFFGSFYLINLMLAVVAMSYEEESEFAGKEKEREKALKRKHNPMYDLAVLTVAKNKLKDKIKDTSDSTKQNSNLSSITEERNDSPLVPRNPDKPLLKKQSKDSGFSSRSQTSTKSNPRLFKDDSQELLSMPEFSEDEKKGAADIGKGTVNKGFVPDSNNSVKAKNQKSVEKVDKEDNVIPSTNSNKTSHQPKGKVSPKQEKPDFVIVTAEDEDPDSNQDNKHIIDRNCKCCKNCCVCFVPWLRWQNKLYIVVSDPFFDLFITFCIIVNTVLMASEHYDMPEELGNTLKISNYVFTFIFTLEAFLKICALSKFYFKNGWNVFDLIIVIASLVDLGLEDIDGLSVFRTFRLLRVFKLAQNWPTMRLLLTIIINTLGALGNLSVILIIIIYIFAVIGLQLFNESYTIERFAPDPVPRWNFNDFFHSLMLVFRILCGEWVEPLWDCMKVENELCMVVFLPTLVFGNFIVLNLFLAMLLNSFASGSMRKHKDNIEANKFKVVWKRIKKYCCCCLPKNMIAPDGEKDKDTTKDSEQDSKDPKKAVVNGTSLPKGLPKTGGAAKKNWKRYAQDIMNDEETDNKGAMSITEWSVKQTFLTNRDQYSKFNDAKTKKVVTDKDKTDAAAKNKDPEDPDDIKMGDTASEHEPANTEVIVHDCMPLFITKRVKCCLGMDETKSGQRWMKFRKVMTMIVSNKFFEGAVLAVIFASSLTLAFEDVHLYESQATQDALYYLNIIFCVLFTVEMFMKWFAFGLKKYFSEFWTILDFFIVVISISSLVAQSLGIDNLSAFRSLRTLRALRPLRAVSRWQGMKIVVNALMMAIPAIINVLLVCLIFWLIFSIMGVQFFAGKFRRCIDTDGNTLSDSIVKNKTDCIAQNYSWENTEINFDDTWNGYLALLQVATFEGWMEVMESAVDSTEIDQQPSFEANLYSYLYFLAFIVFGSFFTLNLFIGVIIDQFNILKKKYDGSYLDMFLTPGQRNYYNTMKKLGSKKPQKTVRRPKNRCQSIFFDVATSNKFELLIVLIIFVNMIVMAVEHYNQSDTITEILEITNIVFTTIFTLEAFVKITGLRWHYFRHPWNVFDFIVVLLSIIGIILDDVLSNVFVTPTLLRVVRIFRIGRVLRLIKAAKGIRKLLFALIISLPALLNIGALLFLVMFIFAIIGMSSFGHLKLDGFLDDIVNFRTFGNTILLLVRLSTSAGWNDILEPMLIQPPHCNDTHWELPSGEWREESGGNCGTPWLAIGYMVSFILISYLIVINMYIAVILENFQQAHEQEEVGITEDDFDMFYVVWERYDPLATQFIKYDQLTEFVSDLDEPLGIPKPNEIALVSFNLPIVEGDKLHCLDVLMALVKCVLGDVEETDTFKELRAQMELKYHDAFPTRVKTTVLSSTMQRKKEDVAAKTLQRSWRRHKTQKQLKNITALAMQRSHSKQTGAASRANSIMSLGRRLSNALSVFFSSSRPSSALSRLSVKSTFSNNDVSPKMKKKKPTKSSPNMPNMAVLYPNLAHDDDINL